MRGSLPYILLLSAVAVGLSAFLWGVMDTFVAEVVATSVWDDGSEDAMIGRDHVLALWDWALLLAMISIVLSVIWASRRGRGSV